MELTKDKSEDSLSLDALMLLLKQAGKRAKKKAFDNNLPIPVLIDGKVFLEYADGKREPYNDKETSSIINE